MNNDLTKKTDTEDEKFEMSFSNKVKKQLIHLFPHIYKNYTIATYTDGTKTISKLDKLKYKDDEELGKIVHLLINEQNANFYTGGEYPNTFKNLYKELKTIEFGSHVKEITGNMPYQPKLEKIIFGKGVERIGADNEGTFRESNKLRKLDFSRAHNLKVIGNGAFLKCSIENLNLPDSLEEIGDFAFSDNGPKIWVNGGIIRMPKNLKSIGLEAFRHTELQGVIFADDSFYGEPEDYLKIPKIEKKQSSSYAIPSIGDNAFDKESNYAWFTTKSFFEKNKETLLGQKICKIEQPEIAKRLSELRKHIRIGGKVKQEIAFEDDCINLELREHYTEKNNKNNTKYTPEIDY